jgi:filamentous hemagglutinin family protein
VFKALFPWFGFSLCTLGYLYAIDNTVLAQVTSDGTVNTQVTENGNTAEITGGETRGDNLFHSFQDFSVKTGNEAFFNNADSISNIFSRVTGGNVSDIDGAIRANGSANLFLINPAGIILGEGASLNIGGSFYGSSASSILFEDGEFGTADLDNPPLLTVNAPIGLGFRDQPGDIVNRSNFGLSNTIIDGVGFTILDSVGLEIKPNQTIALIGGNVILEKAAGISASGGKVELGGLTQAGEITINKNGSLIFPEETARGNVTVTGQSRVKVAADGDGGININARNFELNQQSELHAGITEDSISPDAQAGDITIDTTESVRLVGQPRQAPLELESLTRERDTGTGIHNTVGLSSIIRNDGSSQSNAVGNGGNIKIETKTLELANATVIDTSVFGQGDGGDITINSAEKVVFNQGVILSQIRGLNLETVKEQGNGDAGNVFISTKSLLLTDQALILADVQEEAAGNGGDITIQASDTFVQNKDSFILTQLGKNNIGSAGNIQIEAGSYEIGVRNILPALQSDSQPDAQGNGGNITIDVDNTFSINNNLIISQIQSNTKGDAGNINISANNMSIDNFALISTNAARGSSGTAGKVDLTANNILISNGAIVDALTENEFKGGDITVNANNLNVLNGAKIVTASESIGNAGNINLNIQDNLIINNQNSPADSPFDEPILQNIELQTGLFADTFPGSTSNGGNIFIKTKSLDLQDKGFVLAETTLGEGGNITLNVDDSLTLSNNSLISAKAEGSKNSTGGNVDINANFIVAFPNQVDGNGSDIIASAAEGDGGRISINGESLLGIKERKAEDNNRVNDIDASSEFGLNGTVSIFTPDINPLQGVIELPSNVVEAKQTSEQTCSADREGKANNGLAIAGKGGISPAPDAPLNSENISNENPAQVSIPRPIETSQGKIQPARGIMVTEAGKIILTAYRTNNAGERIPEIKPNCN